MISLDKVRMCVTQTAGNGVVNKETIFNFEQNGSIVFGEYQGGKIKRGYLVGVIENDIFKFNYCQIQIDEKLDNGASTCELSVDEKGKVRLVEHFEWSSRPGEIGTNVFEEI